MRLTDRRLGLAAVLAMAATFSYLAQGPSSPAGSHYSLVRSLANGTAEIDETRPETGGFRTHDVAYFEGHYYSNKAPGLALLALPAYVALEAAGVRTDGEATVMLWALTLLGAALPAVLLLVLVRRVAERLEPGFGTVAAVTLGLGTLLTTFATVFFPHALSATLIFAAFTILLFERRGEPRPVLAAAAGLAAGYAVTTEYDNAIAVVVLGLYALVRVGRLRRGLAYAAGVVAGVLPLLLYNVWAFGSLTHVSYEGTVLVEGTSGHDVLFEVDRALGVPKVQTLVSLLISRWGLLTTAPVLAAGIAGTALVYRRGRRSEALAIAGVGVGYLVYSAAYYEPFGQVPPGPRFLLPALPFLAVALAVAFRAFPLVTAALAAGSVSVAAAVTVTRPLIAWDGHVLFRLAHPSWWSPTVADLAGVVGWYRVLPLIAALVVAVVCAAAVTPLGPVTRRAALGVALALAGWIAVATEGGRLLGRGDVGAALLLCLVLLLAAGIAPLLRPQARMPTGGRAAGLSDTG